MRFARPTRATRRPIGRWVIVGGLAVAAVAAIPAVAAIINPPFADPNIVIATVPGESFVGAEGLSAIPARVEVWRSGVRIARTGQLTPDGGAIDVNHLAGPVENCWVGTTPDIHPGDSVRVVQIGGDEYRTTVRGMSMSAPTRLGTTVTVKFTALDVDGSTALPQNELEVLLRNQAALGGGAPRWLAPGLGVIQDDPDTALAGRYQAVYNFVDEPTAQLAVTADVVEASWLAGGESTAAVPAPAPGPADPCTSPLAVGPLGVELDVASDSGLLGDGVTNDAAPTITGLVSPGAEVNVYLDSSLIAIDGIVDGSGKFTADLGALAPGPHSVRAAEVTDPTPPEVEGPLSAAYPFTIDTAAPAAPTGLTTNPVSPASNTFPSVIGSAEAGSIVTVYPTDGCTGSAIAVGTAAAFASPGLTINVAAGSTTPLSATATDVAGNTSTCSPADIVYVADGIPPATPTGLATNPSTLVSPSSDDTPGVLGVLTPDEVDATIRIYINNPGCTGPPSVTGTEAAFEGAGGITVTVPANQTSTIRARAADAAGNLSACSAAVSYSHDSIAPGAPSITGTTPTSPTNGDLTPLVRGTATGAATVRVYRTDDCSGSFATGSAAAFAAGGIEVSGPVGTNTTTFLTARAIDAAGNISLCSGPFAFVHDTDPPGPPTVDATDPPSPSTVNTPRVKGTAPVESPAVTIRLYTNGTCAGAPAATGTAAAFVAPGIQVPVTENLSNTISARAVDAAGNPSVCSNAITYVEDSTPPAGNPVILSGPSGAQKSRDAAFTFQSVVLDPGDVLECSLSTGADAFGICDSGTTYSRSGLVDGAYSFKVRVRDAQGNANTQTRSFQVDNIAPSVTINATPTDPTSDTTPTFGFVANEPGVTYECGQSTTGTPTFAPCASPATIGPLPLGTWIFFVRATDAAGNVGVAATSGFVLEEPIGAPSVSTKKIVLKSGRVVIAVRCTGPAGARCSGSLDITRRIPGTATRPARDVKIGHVNIALRAGQTIKVSVPINAAGRRALKTAKNRKLATKVVVTPRGGKASVFPLTISLPVLSR